MFSAEPDGQLPRYPDTLSRAFLEAKARLAAKLPDDPHLHSPRHFQRMLKRLIEEDDVDYAIVHKVDRLACNHADDVTINLAIREAGAALVPVTENIDEAPSGALLH